MRPYSAPKRVGPPPDRWLSALLHPEDYPAWRALPAAKRQELRARSEDLWTQAEKRRSSAAWRFMPAKRFSVLTPTNLSPLPYVATLETFAGYLDRVLGPL